MELAIKERTHDIPIAEHVNIEYDDNITTEKFPDHPEDTQTRDNETPHQAAHNTNIQNIRNPYTKQNLNNAAQNNIIHGLSTPISKTLVTPSTFTSHQLTSYTVQPVLTKNNEDNTRRIIQDPNPNNIGKCVLSLKPQALKNSNRSVNLSPDLDP